MEKLDDGQEKKRIELAQKKMKENIEKKKIPSKKKPLTTKEK